MGYSLETDTTTSPPRFAHVSKVGIIGAGVAGLQQAERLIESGKEVTIFEKASEVGGVWRENYADFGLQVPRELYEFPAFPYPKDTHWDKFPKGPAVKEYIQSFARHFGIDKQIRFRTAVLALEQLSDSVEGLPTGECTRWSITHAPSGDASKTTTEVFDFVIVATGMYGFPPNVPFVRGREAFLGEVVHSFDFKDREQARSKRVVVVGGGKSAVDCAVASVNGGAKEVTLLFRQAHWPVPRYLINMIPFKYATYSRLGHALLPTHYDVSAFVWWLHALFTPLKWLVWRLVELLIQLQFRIPTEMVPTERIEIDVFSGGQILTYEARDMIRSGKLLIRKGAIDHFTPEGVILKTDDSTIGCDLVVYGTGFVKSYDVFHEAARTKLALEKDGLYLYRSMLPVRLPGVAFIGSEVSTFNNILTQGLQAAWLSRVLSGALELPPTHEMQRAIETEMHWKRTWMPSTSARAAIQQLHMPKYHDQLMLDLGHAACRKHNPLSEALMPYTARDYSSIFRTNGRAKSKTGTSKQSTKHVTVVTVWPEVETT